MDRSDPSDYKIPNFGSARQPHSYIHMCKCNGPFSFWGRYLETLPLFITIGSGVIYTLWCHINGLYLDKQKIGTFLVETLFKFRIFKNLQWRSSLVNANHDETRLWKYHINFQNSWTEIPSSLQVYRVQCMTFAAFQSNPNHPWTKKRTTTMVPGSRRNTTGFSI